MSYTLKLDDEGILHLTIIGEFGQGDADAYRAEVERLFTSSPSEQVRHFIVDTRQSTGRADPPSRKMVTELYRRNKEGKVAIVGLSAHHRVMAGLASKIRGQDKVGFFGTEEDALVWLRSD